MSASSILRRKIDLVIPQFVYAGDRLVGHPRVRELYPEYLFVSHCVIRASVPLMAAARDVALAGDDALCAALAPYYAEHITEELDHDEWLLDDLELIGYERSAVLRRLPPPTVASL